MASDIWDNKSTSPARYLLHASAVSAFGKALVLAGPSGVGKSTVALELMAYGAELIADDLVEIIRTSDDQLLAKPPQEARPLIEARGLGLLPAILAAPAPIAAFVDMRKRDLPRLPDPKSITIHDLNVPCLHRSRDGAFAPALWHYLKGQGSSSHRPT